MNERTKKIIFNGKKEKKNKNCEEIVINLYIGTIHENTVSCSWKYEEFKFMTNTTKKVWSTQPHVLRGVKRKTENWNIAS